MWNLQTSSEPANNQPCLRFDHTSTVYQPTFQSHDVCMLCLTLKHIHQIVLLEYFPSTSVSLKHPIRHAAWTVLTVIIIDRCTTREKEPWTDRQVLSVHSTKISPSSARSVACVVAVATSKRLLSNYAIFALASATPYMPRLYTSEFIVKEIEWDMSKRKVHRLSMKCTRRLQDMLKVSYNNLYSPERWNQ